MTRDFFRVRAYLRYSSHNQDDGFSIEYQSTEIQEFAHKNGFEIEKMHIDQAQTATKTAGRDEFFALMDAVKRNEVDVIVVYKTSRIFRNSYESHKYRELFKKHNVKFISVTQNIDESTAEGRFMASTIANVDQYQAETTSDHVKSSMREMARQGYYTGGRVLFGYNLESFEHGGRIRKKYTPNDEQAKIVKILFEMFAKGNSVVEIMNHFMQKDYRNNYGKFFNEQNLRNMLKNDCYVGVIRYKVQDHDEIVTENAHPAIISENLWNAVQHEFSKKKPVKPRKKKYSYSLTGKVFCGHCGTHFFGCSSTAVRGKHRYTYHSYVCRKKRNFRNCENPQIKKELLEDIALEAIKMKILNEDCINHIVNMTVEEYENAPSNVQWKIRDLNKRKTDINKQLNILTDMRLNGEMSGDILKQRSVPLQQELLEIEKHIFVFEEQKSTSITPDEVKSFLLDMLKKSDDASESAKKILFNHFIENIVVSRHEVKVNLRVFSSEKLAYNSNIATPIFSLYAYKYR